MSRALPSASADLTALRTAGWVQPPPIQPSIAPSARTMALAPALAEVAP